jgi:hypothetical protein
MRVHGSWTSRHNTRHASHMKRVATRLTHIVEVPSWKLGRDIDSFFVVSDSPARKLSRLPTPSLFVVPSGYCVGWATDSDVKGVTQMTLASYVASSSRIGLSFVASSKWSRGGPQSLVRIPSRRVASYSAQTPWPLVCKRTIPTERPPLVDKI